MGVAGTKWVWLTQCNQGSPRLIKGMDSLYHNSLRLVGSQSQKEDDKEMVSVPKHLEVRASDELQGGRDHEEKGHCDHMTSDASSCCKADGDGILSTHSGICCYFTVSNLRGGKSTLCTCLVENWDYSE